MRAISKYQVFSELHSGPITRVYKAIQSELQRVVLVKQLNPDRITDTELVERFKQEGLILAKINSPHVITIFDFGYDEDVPFLVTEFIEGITLAGLIEDNGTLPWDIGLFVLQQLAQGLSAIHQKNIIHQDIKPQNIFISNDGEVKLGDLGFSVSLDQIDPQIQGTPAYLAPEVVAGLSVDFRSDLYSLGLVGYEMMTGENPYAANDISTVLNRIINLTPMDVRAVRSEVPEKFSSLIARLIARNPEQRFQNAREFSQELENLKISMGINIDVTCLVNFLKNPDNYQPAPTISSTFFAAKIQVTKKKILPAVAFGVIVMMILIILLGKLMNDGFSFLPDKKDRSTATLDQNFAPTDTLNKVATISSEDNKDLTAQYKERVTDRFIIDNEGDKDTFNVSNLAEQKLDTISLVSDPRAWIFRNGDSLGITPLALVLFSTKEPVELELRAPGFPVIKKAVTVTDPIAHNIHINLWREVGYLEIDIVPWGAIWIDGDSIDVSPLGRPIILAPGNHRLVVRHPSLKNITEPFYVAVGETTKKTIQLRRTP